MMQSTPADSVSGSAFGKTLRNLAFKINRPGQAWRARCVLQKGQARLHRVAAGRTRPSPDCRRAIRQIDFGRGQSVAAAWNAARTARNGPWRAMLVGGATDGPT